MPFCIAFAAACFCFFWGDDFSFEFGLLRLCDWKFLTCDVCCCVGLGWLGVALGLLVYWLKCLTRALLSQFKFPSPFTRAYLHSPQLVQEALEAFNIGPSRLMVSFSACVSFNLVMTHPGQMEWGVVRKPSAESWRT